ncbi:MAG: LacI family DNA-binding transcriptional regulator [Deltaproteobacteria bacterium]|nr:LacI family DNA-binding transcriptional regulator [Deltaproteobacteria bacterium]MBW2152690.1 LacI family DNA-binding transcriptional regulator [Deltaproteobacteria bacterium]
MPTIKDIARKANVSTATVSHVINETRFVSKPLKRKVKAVIEELGYQPNRIARSLVIQKTHTIGVIVSDILNPFYTAVVRGLEDATSAFGYNVMLCNTDEDPDKEIKYIRLLLEKRADGIALATCFQGNEHPLMGQLNQATLVTIVRRIARLKSDAVFADNVGGAYKAIEHLISLGHRRIGVISGPSGFSSGRERLEGVLKALNDHDISPNEAWMPTGDFKQESGYLLAKKIIQCKNPPSALFVSNNRMTLGALKALRELGIQIPKDISIVGLDDTEWSILLNPPLTVIHQSPYDMGNIAGKMLLGRIFKKRKRFKTNIIPAKLIERGSSAPPRE